MSFVIVSFFSNILLFQHIGVFLEVQKCHADDKEKATNILRTPHTKNKYTQLQSF